MRDQLKFVIEYKHRPE